MVNSQHKLIPWMVTTRTSPVDGSQHEITAKLIVWFTIPWQSRGWLTTWTNISRWLIHNTNQSRGWSQHEPIPWMVTTRRTSPMHGSQHEAIANISGWLTNDIRSTSTPSGWVTGDHEVMEMFATCVMFPTVGVVNTFRQTQPNKELVHHETVNW